MAERFFRIFQRPPGPIKFFTYVGAAFVVERIWHGYIQPRYERRQWEAVRERMERPGAAYRPHLEYMSLDEWRKRRDIEVGERRLLALDFTWQQLEGGPAPKHNDLLYDRTRQQLTEADMLGTDKKLKLGRSNYPSRN